MKSIFLENDIMEILASIYAGEQIDDAERSRKKEKLEELLRRVNCLMKIIKRIAV